MKFDRTRVQHALERSWSSRTCAQWSAENRARGQCNVTALAVHELFGGRILKTPIGELWHFYNQVEGVVHDFTASQFEAPPQYHDVPASPEEALAGTSVGQLSELLGALRSALSE